MIATREVELKLQLDMADIDMLVGAPFLANVKMQERVQTSTYFDTPEPLGPKVLSRFNGGGQDRLPEYSERQPTEHRCGFR